MKILYEIKEMLEDELKQMCKKGDVTQTDLDNMYKMVDIVKDITTIEAMEETRYEGWSRDYSREYSRTGDTDYSNAYPIYRTSRDDASYARGRDSMGRYTSRDSGYSRHGNDEMIEHLKEMMMNARTEEERESYRKTIENLSR